jgi:hypothetical protein
MTRFKVEKLGDRPCSDECCRPEDWCIVAEDWGVFAAPVLITGFRDKRMADAVARSLERGTIA